MSSHKFLMFILGLTGIIVPARATLSFNSGDASSGTLNSALTAFDNASSLDYALQDLTFAGSLSTASPYTYTDLNGVEFLGFQQSGSSVGAQESLSKPGGAELEAPSLGLIEISLPANTYSFGLELTDVSGFSEFCFEAAAEFNSSNCSLQNPVTVISPSDTAFVGVVSSTALSTLWVGPYTESPTAVLLNYDAGSPTPEGSTLALLGSGLILLGLIRGRRRAWARAE